MDALASSERASQWTPAPTPSTAAHPDGLRATGTSTQKSEHGVLCAIRAATTLSVGPTSWDAVRERQVFHRQVLTEYVPHLYSCTVAVVVIEFRIPSATYRRHCCLYS